MSKFEEAFKTFDMGPFPGEEDYEVIGELSDGQQLLKHKITGKKISEGSLLANNCFNRLKSMYPNYPDKGDSK